MDHHEHSPHDNIDVKLQNRMSFHNSHITIFFVPVILLGIFLFGSWVISYHSAFVQALPWIVWSAVGLVATTCVLGMAAFALHFIGKPGTHLILDAMHSIVDACIKWNRRVILDSGPAHITYLRRGEVVVTPIIQERHIHKHAELPAPADPEEAGPGSLLPSYIRYEDVAHKVPRGHTLLGAISANDVFTLPFSCLDTMVILGGSKTGKTNGIRIKVKEGHDLGRRLVVCDPHLHKSDSLYNGIKDYAHDFLLPVASTHEGILDSIAAFKEEALRRIAGGSYVDGWTIIVDEINALCGAPGLRDEQQKEMYQAIAPLAKLCGQQLRGYDMSGWFIGQSPIGLPWLVDSAMTVIVHKLVRENQQKNATNSNRDIMHDMANWPCGRVFCYGLDVRGEHLLQQPVFASRTVDADLSRPLEDLRQNRPERSREQAGTGFSPQKCSNLNNGTAPERAGEQAGTDFDADELVSVKNELRNIGKHLQNGKSVAEIVKSYDLPRGRATQEMTATVNMVKSVIDEEN